MQDFSPDTDKTLNVVDEKAKQQQAKPFQSILFAWLTKHTHTRESESEEATKKMNLIVCLNEVFVTKSYFLNASKQTDKQCG